jgi:5'-nucleotidase
VRILVTNDDGIRAEGISTLARALAGAGHDVVLVAPTTNMSGMSAALGPLEMGENLDVTHVEVAGLEGWAVPAPPALGIFAACQGAFGPPPDLVASGINAGLNTGRSVLHSGTVGAALTACTFGVPALAVSVDVAEPWHFATAASVALQGLEWLIENPVEGSVLNLNVPALPLDGLRGLRWAELDVFGAVQTTGQDPGQGLGFELRSRDRPPAADSDLALVEAGFATASILCPISALDPGRLRPIDRPGPVAVRPYPTTGPVDHVTELEHEARPLGGQ